MGAVPSEVEGIYSLFVYEEEEQQQWEGKGEHNAATEVKELEQVKSEGKEKKSAVYWWS